MQVGPDTTFRRRVFGHVQARVKVSDLKNVFDSSLDQLSDLDAVRLCLLMLLEVGFMGCHVEEELATWRDSEAVVAEFLDLFISVVGWICIDCVVARWVTCVAVVHLIKARSS
ncbi:hypothetical protein HanXRQr2_Chr07g0278811 [Helianthus annuus]|uniref:Uncharacterized protein n=1 Tax=Helianthus annuus TaxID=4232 RepID=A0A9K3NEW0_HELAN|nr:hypothetical protein HanXRQr2_Chr07g0278811 [Helianthus annuus]KAJ0561989.1 hypothetical protein HanHA89_Chr07g0246121 [Helianthus annuus]